MPAAFSPVLGSVPPVLAQMGDASGWGVGGNSTKGWLLVAAVFAIIAVGGYVFRRTTRAGVLAAATAKEAVRQPVFLLSAALAAAILVINTFLPFFSLGEDVKMLKDCGLATMLIVGLLVAVWTAGTTIHDEIEGRTAMTLLSKPINRRQFVLGKYLGILQAVGLLTVIRRLRCSCCWSSTKSATTPRRTSEPYRLHRVASRAESVGRGLDPGAGR